MAQSSPAPGHGGYGRPDGYDPIRALVDGADEVVGRRLLATPASEIRPRSVTWLEYLRAPLGALTLLAGRQGLGKSQLITGTAAQLSNGEMPGDLNGEPADVLLVSFEDHPETTIVPRLIAAGADLSRVHILGASEDGAPDLVSLPGDLERIADHALRVNAKLLAIDPLVAALPGQIDSHRDQDVRRALAPLGQLAEATDLAVIAVIHLRKTAGEALDRVSGSIAFTAAARSVLAFGADPADDEGPGRVLAHAKSNVGPLAPSLAYRIEPATVEAAGETIATSRLVLVGECDAAARDVLSPPVAGDRTEIEAAVEWLADELADGEWHASREVKQRAKSAEIAERTLERARVKLGADRDRQGFPSRAVWRLAVPPTTSGGTGVGESGGSAESGLPMGKAAISGSQSRQKAHIGGTGANGHRGDAEIERLIAVADAAERDAGTLGLEAWDE
jgi:hypothetical protein